MESLPAPNSPAPNAPRAFGRFELRRLLGQGAMGEVYLAWDPAAGREVALKTTRTGDPARFLREAQLMAALRHPGIVRIFEADVVGGVPYMACEVVEGAQELDEVWPDLTLPERVERVRDAARAVGQAHAQGIVHRDLKPANVLVDREGRVRVTDFGLATTADLERLTRTGHMVGTPTHLAPEQFRGLEGEKSPITAASDVWALGVILYEALCGQPPFGGATLVELGAQILTGPIEPPDRVDPDVPASLCRVCLQALQRDPAERYGDAAALGDALDEALDGRGPGGAGRRRDVLLGVALGAVVAAAGLAAVWVLARPGGEPAVAAASPGDADPLPPPGQPDPPAPAPERTVEELLSAGEVDRAVERLEAHLELHPEDVAARRLLGVTWHDRGERAAAAAALEEVLQAAPGDLEVYYRLAVLRDEEGAVAAPPDLDRDVGERDGRALLWRGRVRYAYGRLQDALADLNRACELEPGVAACLAARAAVRDDLGDLRGAVADLTAAIERQPERGELYAARADLRLRLRDTRGGLADVQEAARLAPRGVEARRVRANVLAGQGRPRDARQLLDELLAEDLPGRTRAVVLTDRALLHASGGEVDAAMADFAAALECDPQAVDTLTSRASIHLARRELEAALGDLEAALAIRPNAPDTLVALGIARLQADRPEQALVVLERALEADPRNPTALANRGLARGRLGERDAAIADLERALSLMSARFPSRLKVEEALKVLRKSERLSSVEDWVAEGRRLRDRGDMVGALSAFKKARSLDPDAAQPYYGAADVILRLGDAETALINYDRALELDPSLLDARGDRGVALQSLGEHPRAVADFEAVLAADPRNKVAWNNLAISRKRLQQLDAARAAADRAVELDPDYLNARLNRAAIRAVQGDPRGALQDLDHALAIAPEGFAVGYAQRGLVRQQLGDLEGARADFRAYLARAAPDAPRRDGIEQRLEALGD